MIRLNIQHLALTSPTKKSVPSWVTKDGSGKPATLVLDIQNNRGWYAGRKYSEAGALAAVGGVASGITRLIGGYDVPGAPQLVPNADFTDGLTGWTALAGATMAVVNGKLEMSGTGLTNPTVRSGAIPSTQGKVYKARVTYYKGTAAGSPSIVTSRSASMSPLSNGMPSNTTTVPVTNERTYGGEGAAHYIGIRTVSGPGGTVYAEGISVRESVAFAGFSTPAFAARLKFRTPASLPASPIVLASFDDGLGVRNRIKAQLETDGTMSVILTSNGVDRQTHSIPAAAMTLDAEHTLHLSSDGATRFLIALDDTRLIGQQGGFTPPGIGWIRLGMSYQAGAEWTGQILSAEFFGREYAPPRFIWTVGDSYVAGTGGASVEQGIEASDPTRLCIATGLGGSSVATQLTAMQGTPGLFGCVLVHWDGDANSSNAETDPGVFEQMAALASRHIFVGSGIRVNHTAEERLNAATRNTYLAGRFGTRYLDPMPILLGLSTGSAEDLAAVQLGCIPPSCLQTDGTHLTPAAMIAVGAGIVAAITSQGW